MPAQKDVRREMTLLLRRGTAALRETLADTPKHKRPIGLSIHVVTEDDFAEHADTILQYVVGDGIPTHVICLNGALCARIERLTGRRWHI